MSTENTQSAPAAGEGAASADASAGTSVNETTTSAASASAGAVADTGGETTAGAASPAAAAQAATTAAPTYTPNYKYKAALQEKELDEFWRPLIKDADSEKKVKDLFTRVDAFDFMKSKKESLEQEYQNLYGDFENVNKTVQRFQQSVNQGDLSSAFRLAGITKEQIFKWTQEQLHLMEMPPEQRAQIEQYEQARLQKYDLEQKVNYFQQQYENQAVQARAVQLDVALLKPEVARFAESWDKNTGQEGSFRQFVIEEAQKAFYTTQQDLSPDQAIGLVMQRFGKFLNTGDAVSAQQPQAVSQATGMQKPPVIPKMPGTASSPVKKVPKSLAELKALAKEMGA